MRDKIYYDYLSVYDDSYSSDTLAGYMLRKSHLLLEKSLPIRREDQHVLEIGAGTGHHYQFVDKSKIASYVITDGSDSALKLISEKYQKEIQQGSIVVKQADALDLTAFNDKKFDRVIATHVLEHIPAPIDALKEWSRVLKQGGILSLVLPCDPGMLWRFGRYFGPRRTAVKAGLLHYDYIQAIEHVNPIFNLYQIINYHFDQTIDMWWPCRIAFPDINLFYICHMINE